MKTAVYVIYNDDTDESQNEYFNADESDEIFLEQPADVIEWIMKEPKVGDYFMGVRRIK